MLGSVETSRLALVRCDHAVHAPALAEINAEPEVMEFVGAGRPVGRAESDELTRRIAL